jgi:hypothetical protein
VTRPKPSIPGTSILAINLTILLYRISAPARGKIRRKASGQRIIAPTDGQARFMASRAEQSPESLLNERAAHEASMTGAHIPVEEKKVPGFCCRAPG